MSCKAISKILLTPSYLPQVADIASLIKDHHPYSCPELITVDVVDGLPDYLRWVAESVAAKPTDTGNPPGAP